MPAPAWECACGAANDATSPVCFACGRAAPAPVPAITWGNPSELVPADEHLSDGVGGAVGVLTATGGRRAPERPPAPPALPPIDAPTDPTLDRPVEGRAGRRARGPVLPVRRATGGQAAPETPAHWPIPTFHPADGPPPSPPSAEAPPQPEAPARRGPRGTDATSPTPTRNGRAAGRPPRPTTVAPPEPSGPPFTTRPARADDPSPARTPLTDAEWRARLGLDDDDLAGADWATDDDPRPAPRRAEPADGDGDDWRARLGIDRDDLLDHPAPGFGGVRPPEVAYRPPAVHDRRSSAAEPPPALPPVTAERRNAVALSLAGLFDGGADHDPGAVPAGDPPARPKARISFSEMDFDEPARQHVERRTQIFSAGGIIALLAVIVAVYVVVSFTLHSSAGKPPNPNQVTPATPSATSHR